MNRPSAETKSTPENPFAATRSNSPARVMEGLGLLTLLGLAVWCVKVSWRKWPDPLVDFGLQLYTAWRLSQGGALYHDFIYSYGPLSVHFNAGLFRVFGPGIMVLAIANLFIYTLILALAYYLFRRAWGALGAFAASAVFISVFSFSQLAGVANYNYVTPYSAESVHGILLILLMVPVACRWQRESSLKFSFLLGLGGGMSAVLKPEFMLAMGVLGSACVVLRLAQRKKIRLLEILLLLTGTLLPTLCFTLWFARNESLRAAFIDASQAWWLVVVQQVQNSDLQQWNFSGFDNPGANLLGELKSTFSAGLLVMGIGLAGWIINRSWNIAVRMAIVIALGCVLWFIPHPGGWRNAGQCLPGLILIVLIIVAWQVRAGWHASTGLKTRPATALFLALLGVAMLARMLLFARIGHMGFFQAALAAMVVVAFLTSNLPQLAGAVGRGGDLVRCAFLILIFAGCGTIMHESRVILDDQTEVVGTGRDRFYATIRNLNETGALVNWAAEKMRAAPPEATLLVLPE
jgi:hypothetical protein